MIRKLVVVTAILICSVITSYAQVKGDAILGVWMSAKKDTKFEILKLNGKYFGKILWGTGSETRDVKNPDVRLKNREIIGLVILNDLIYDGESSWEKGTIYDPREGKTYSCKLTLKTSDQLNVRGFVGVSFFGRTETWTKIK